MTIYLQMGLNDNNTMICFAFLILFMFLKIFII